MKYRRWHHATTAPGIEHYQAEIALNTSGQVIRYAYRHYDGREFECKARTLKNARERRNAFLRSTGHES